MSILTMIMIIIMGVDHHHDSYGSFFEGICQIQKVSSTTKGYIFFHHRDFHVDHALIRFVESQRRQESF